MPRGEKKEGDPLRMYTLVMGVLVVVMGVLYFVIDAKRKDYAAANAAAEQYMTGKGLRPSSSETPQTIPDLALAVERLSVTFGQAAGATGLERAISRELMDTQAQRVGLRQKGAGRERMEPNRARKYVTISNTFDYGAPDGGDVVAVWQVLGLLYNIESQTRYRVSELSWQVAEETENPEPPFDRVKRVQIQVALRAPALEEGR
jgi:hypothetical protein